jgi:hypothetical protein
MTCTWPRIIATGSSIATIALLVALGLTMSLTSPPNLVTPSHSAPASGGGAHGTVGTAAGATAAAARAPRTFYVAPNGRDSNRGTSPARPWRTVARVDRASLQPGDRVVFKGGATFSDNPLMPGLGYKASGTTGDPIVFGSYGRGKAQLTKGVWLGPNNAHPQGPSYLTFEDLSLGPVEGFQGTGDYITLRHLTISHLIGPRSRQETGIASEGSDWVIESNTIYDTGDSGMLLGFRAGSPGDPAGGVGYVVSANTVSHTGLDGRIPWAKHAIYLKVANATVTDNRLTYFKDDGISMRYRNAMVSNNYIAHGGIGLAWYQYDPLPGTTQLIANTIASTNEAAIFVCGVKEGCRQPIESFVVQDNLLRRSHGVALDLQPTHGTYQIASNLGLGGTVAVPTDPVAGVPVVVP